MKKFLLIITSLLFLNLYSYSQIPSGYYDNASGLNGYQLKTELHNIIDNHNSESYDYLWTAFQSTDKKANGFVWDMYSDVPGSTPAYDYTFRDDQCGNYTEEGSCYNREHSFPKSWFNDASPMYSDLFHLYPTDGYVNGKRSNYPFGEVGSASWTSTNGCKLGTSSFTGYSGTVFEPIDEYKGDFARTYFYMATRYEDVLTSWSSDMLDGSSDRVYSEWAVNLLLKWHTNDPVSTKETNRNDAVYDIQNNRNPFIDHPEYVAQIWKGLTLNTVPVISNITYSPNEPTNNDTVTILANITANDDDEGETNYNEGRYYVNQATGIEAINSDDISIFPNPASNYFYIKSKSINSKYNIKIYNALGNNVFILNNININSKYKVELNNIQSGLYFVNIQNNNKDFIFKLFIK
ncbi:MAG: endonuclease [Bacteroidota bacterium]|nr:endonuclease [Bacteroidota bacterium]